MQSEPTVTHAWHVLPAPHVRPTQQSLALWQDWVAALHESQMHPSVVVQSAPVASMQERAGLCVQHCDVEVQPWYCDWQAVGTAHFPEMHCSAGALQQSAFATQLAPVAAQVLADWHVPNTAPGATLQARPVQQSPSFVQVPFRLAHGAAQVPFWQSLEQQSLATEQLWPFGLHCVDGWHLKPVPPPPT